MIVDSNLPVERDRLKNRLIRLVKEDNEIISCFFGGSIGSNQEDYYSDIDARIVVKEHVNLRRKQREIINSIGEHLFIETEEENYSVIHYATFIKLDLFIYFEEELFPNIWLKKIEIVKDNGWLKELQNYSQQVMYRVTQEEFDAILFKYYGYYFELYRSLKRGETNYFEDVSLHLKQSLVSMWYIEKGFCPNKDYGWSKYEGNRSELTWHERIFLKSFTPLPREDVALFTQQIRILMFESTEKVAVYNNLFFDKDVFREVHRLISFT
ncbi:hypothetical protein [Vagococcus sp.]|uniref:hypothetical protein n=1 Tax=Vagococcus sp. TaxID=1933889 RepID=UPI003F9B5BEE